MSLIYKIKLLHHSFSIKKTLTFFFKKNLQSLFLFTQLPDNPISNPVIFFFENCGKEKRSWKLQKNFLQLNQVLLMFSSRTAL